MDMVWASVICSPVTTVLFPMPDPAGSMDLVRMGTASDLLLSIYICISSIGRSHVSLLPLPILHIPLCAVYSAFSVKILLVLRITTIALHRH